MTVTRPVAQATVHTGANRLLAAWLMGARISAGIFISLLIISAVFPTLLTGIDPIATNSSQVLAGPGAEHWFGTDQSGRDVYARVVHGTRTSILVGLRAVGIALVVGALLGTLAGLAPRWADRVISRVIEMIMAFPEFLIALLVVAILGKGGTAVALGGFGSAIVSAAGLSFLGLGVPPPTPEWGLMMSEGKNQLHNAWWITFFPGLALSATVIAITTIARPLQRRLEEGQ